MAGHGFQGRLLAWVGIAVLSTYCLFFGGAWQATYYADLRVWALIPAFAGVAVWMMVAVRDAAWRPSTALAPAFVVAFAAFGLSTLTSRMPRLSVEYLALAILLTVLYLILQRLMASAFFRSRLISFAALAGLLIGIAYVAVTVPHWFAWWGFIGHVAAPPLRPAFESLTLGNPSAVMTASVLLAAPAVANLVGRSRRGRVTALGIVTLTAIVTLISGSRSGWLAIGIAGIIVGGLWLASSDHRTSVGAMIRSRTARFAALPVLVAGIVGAVVVGPGLILRATAGGEGVRTAFYSSTLRMFQSSPLVGTGPGTWTPQRIAYTVSGETDYYIPHAHNIYLQTLSEFGLVGLAAGTVVVVMVARLLSGAIRSPDPARRRMGWAASFATVYFAAHQFLDFYANAPAILFAFAIPISWLDGTAPRTAAATGRAGPWIRQTHPRSGLMAGLALGTAVAGAAVFLTWSEIGASFMSQGSNLLNDRKPEEAVIPLSRAVRMDNTMPPYHLALGLALAGSGDLVGAEQEFSAAASMDGLPAAWLDLAAVRARQGHRDEAVDALRAAMRLGDQQAGLAIGAGEVSLEVGDDDAAVSAFAQALLLSPTLAGDDWWTSDPVREAIWPDVYRAAFERASAQTRFQMALETGDSRAASDAIAEMGEGDLATTSAMVLSAWNGDAASLASLQARARERPLDLTVVNWCANLFRRANDEETAAQYSAWAETVNGDASITGYEVRVTSDREQHVVAGINSLFYGHYTYRRPVPSVQLVSWLPELRYE